MCITGKDAFLGVPTSMAGKITHDTYDSFVGYHVNPVNKAQEENYLVLPIPTDRDILPEDFVNTSDRVLIDEPFLDTVIGCYDCPRTRSVFSEDYVIENTDFVIYVVNNSFSSLSNQGKHFDENLANFYYLNYPKHKYVVLYFKDKVEKAYPPVFIRYVSNLPEDIVYLVALEGHGEIPSVGNNDAQDTHANFLFFSDKPYKLDLGRSVKKLSKLPTTETEALLGNYVLYRHVNTKTHAGDLILDLGSKSSEFTLANFYVS